MFCHYSHGLYSAVGATVPLVGDRYYSDAARLVAVICAIFICMTHIMGQMRGVGIVFSVFLGLRYDGSADWWRNRLLLWD